MSHFSEMDWNTKWDWENFVAFGSKSIESPKKLQLADWMIVDDGETFNLSASGSDGAKSSISASTDSSTPNIRGGNSGNFSKRMEMNVKEVSRTSSPPLEASVGSAEPLIGLKLGKRTYFENSNGGGNVKSSSSLSVMPNPPITNLKKTKSSGHNVVICCQVEGCNVDLSLAKDYHRKHRVCDTHSKSQKVIVGGLERRFCQQCSRFHNLSEFDDKKRSCRRRLSDHNARRRKPQQETIQFNSTRLASTLYGGIQQMSFGLNNSPGNSTRDKSCNSKSTLTKVHSSKSNADEELHMQGMKLLHGINIQNGVLLASKNSTSEVLNPGSKGSMISSLDADAAPAYRRALSLLSSNSWDASCPSSDHSINPLYNPNDLPIPIIHPIPEGVPLSCYEIWANGNGQHHSPANQRLQSLPTSSSNFQQVQLLKPSYDSTDFYSNMLNLN